LPPLDGAMQFQLCSLTGQLHTIEVSSNLQSWSNWTNLTPTNATTLLRDPAASYQAPRFYRARMP